MVKEYFANKQILSFDIDENEQNLLCLGKKGEVFMIKNVFETQDDQNDTGIKIISAKSDANDQYWVNWHRKKPNVFSLTSKSDIKFYLINWPSIPLSVINGISLNSKTKLPFSLWSSNGEQIFVDVGRDIIPYSIKESESIIESMRVDCMSVDVRDNVAFVVQEKFNQTADSYYKGEF